MKRNALLQHFQNHTLILLWNVWCFSNENSSYQPVQLVSFFLKKKRKKNAFKYVQTSDVLFSAQFSNQSRVGAIFCRFYDCQMHHCRDCFFKKKKKNWKRKTNTFHEEYEVKEYETFLLNLKNRNGIFFFFSKHNQNLNVYLMKDLDQVYF